MIEYYDSLSHELKSIILAANTIDATVLITGNTGTGKSKLATIIHEKSKRQIRGKFIKVNLATLSESLIESELFGHEKGAFTGADNKRIGKLEEADGGTIFLDEIGELNLKLQSKLLDFIQYKRITPVGSNREISLDVRILSATNVDLKKAIKENKFRADLYHRLKIFQIDLPNISASPIGTLNVAHKIYQAAANLYGIKNAGFTADYEQFIMSYDWPGNYRELENVIEYSLALAVNNKLDLCHLPNDLRVPRTKPDDNQHSHSSFQSLDTSESLTPPVEASKDSIGYISVGYDLDFHESRARFEKIYLERIMEICGGKINEASRITGLNKMSLSDKLKKYNVDWKSLRKTKHSSSKINLSQLKSHDGKNMFC
jgi:DNA-binding NtrC family response regulator